MKVAIISHHFPPDYNAGAEQYAYRIAKGLKKQGYAVEVVCIESIREGSIIPSCKTETYENFLVHRLYFDLKKAPDRFEWSFRNPELGGWVKEFLQRFGPDVAHINSGYLLGGTVIEAAYDLGIPTCLTLHDYWFLCPLVTLLRRDGQICEEQVHPSRCAWCLISEKRRYKLPDRLFKGILGDVFVQLNYSKMISKAIGAEPLVGLIKKRRDYLKKIIGKVDVVLSPSRFLMDKVKEYGFLPRRFQHAPLGIVQEGLTVHDSDKKRSKICIGYLGQIVPHKGVHILLNAFKRLKKQTRPCELWIHGKVGADSSYGKRILKSMSNDSRIKFAGSYENSEVSMILNNLDVVVVPSIWYEVSATVILEAQAAKTPLIASAIGGIPELIRHDCNGLLFKTGSSRDLFMQLHRILDEPHLLTALREKIPPVKSAQEEVKELALMYTSVVNKNS